MHDARVPVSDGRWLAFTDLGDPDGSCVFHFHRAPTSRLELVHVEGPLTARGLRVVAPDRPGYGGSSPQPGQSMGDWADDVTALADALDIEQFFVSGYSSGGRMP